MSTLSNRIFRRPTRRLLVLSLFLTVGGNVYSKNVDWFQFTCNMHLVEFDSSKQILSGAEGAKVAGHAINRFIGDCEVLFEPRGTRRGNNYYPDVFRFGGVLVAMDSRPESRINPRCSVTFDGSSILEFGLDRCVEQWEKLSAHICEQVVDFKLSRLDICVDCIDEPTSAVENCYDLGLRKGRMKRYRCDRSNSVTHYHGSQDVVLRVYDKLGQMSAKPCPLQKALMIKNRWGGVEPEKVTRVEYQLRRGYLKSVGVTDYFDYLRRESLIIDDLTLDRFQVLNKPVKSGNYRTVKTHRQWERIRDCFHNGVQDASEPLTPCEKQALDTDQLYAQAGSLLMRALLANGETFNPQTFAETAIRNLEHRVSLKDCYERARKKVNPDPHHDSAAERIVPF